MTASLRRRPSTHAAPPLEDEDLLEEILIRLPPLPSSLPRASAVCKRWRGLVGDPRFASRFRIHHRRNPPLLGCFVRRCGDIYFEPALEAPDRVPKGRFTFPVADGKPSTILGCRHGLMLTLHGSQKQIQVWDPVTGDQHRLDIPPVFEFDMEGNPIAGAVLRTDQDVQHFQVVLVGTSGMQDTQAVARVYSSETGVWGDLISTPVPSELPMSDLSSSVSTFKPAVMAGDSLYWKLVGDFVGILEFDLEKQCLAVIQVPMNVPYGPGYRQTWDILAEGGGLCFVFQSTVGFYTTLWKRKKGCDGVYSWVRGTSIQLDELLSLKSKAERGRPWILGCAEDNNAVLLWTSIGVFTLQLESLQFKKLFGSYSRCQYYPFEGVYTADTGIGGRQHGAELLHNTEDDYSE